MVDYNTNGEVRKQAKRLDRGSSVYGFDSRSRYLNFFMEYGKNWNTHTI